MFLANSLVDGFFQSNWIGKGIVLIQLAASVAMVAALLKKGRELSYLKRQTRMFLDEFAQGGDCLEHYLTRKTGARTGIVAIYRSTCDRLLKLLAPDARALLLGRRSVIDGRSTYLTTHEVRLINGTCEHALDEEEIRVRRGTSFIATIVSLSPMLGLLGTVWGVLDAFAAMGTAGSANLATIAPSIASALVTTVVGLLVAMPGVAALNKINSLVDDINSDMEGFADELIGRIACEFQDQGKGA